MRLYTVTELMARWQCCRSHIYRMIESGELDYVKTAPKYRFTFEMVKKAEGEASEDAQRAEMYRDEAARYERALLGIYKILQDLEVGHEY